MDIISTQYDGEQLFAGRAETVRADGHPEAFTDKQEEPEDLNRIIGPGEADLEERLTINAFSESGEY